MPNFLKGIAAFMLFGAMLLVCASAIIGVGLLIATRRWLLAMPIIFALLVWNYLARRPPKKGELPEDWGI